MGYWTHTLFCNALGCKKFYRIGPWPTYCSLEFFYIWMKETEALSIVFETGESWTVFVLATKLFLSTKRSNLKIGPQKCLVTFVTSYLISWSTESSFKKFRQGWQVKHDGTWLDIFFILDVYLLSFNIYFKIRLDGFISMQ